MLLREFPGWDLYSPGGEFDMIRLEVLMSTTVQPITAYELLRMPEDGFRYDLLRPHATPH